MKIGILTHPLRSNSGGILQNYALQKILTDMGHDVCTIDRHHDRTMLYDFISWISRNIRHYILRQNVPTHYKIVPNRNEFMIENEVFNNFIQKNIRRTTYIKSDNKLYKVNGMGFDAIVVGSDQIWSKEYAPASFLDFLKSDKTLRIAYAASFGKDVNEFNFSNGLIHKIKPLLQKFRAISVREDSGVEICKRYFGIEAVHVLDPTFLLRPSSYNTLSSGYSLSDRGFLFSYILDKNERKSKMVEKIASKLKLKVIDYYELEKPSIELWLAGFRDAQFVVTDSFHGTAFSINFNKQFVAINNSQRGSTRFMSLLKLLSLEDRLVDSDFTLQNIDDIIVHEIEYTAVNDKVTAERIKSIHFLEQALS